MNHRLLSVLLYSVIGDKKLTTVDGGAGRPIVMEDYSSARSRRSRATPSTTVFLQTSEAATRRIDWESSLIDLAGDSVGGGRDIHSSGALVDAGDSELECAVSWTGG